MNDAENLLSRIVSEYRRVLGDDLVGLYLHGSLAFGCFTWERSDVDFIAVVERPLEFCVKQALIDAVIELNKSAPPKGIEMSVVTADVCRPFVYPTPYETHFSNSHLAAYTADRDAHLRRLCGTDPDLAAHFTVINKVGRLLYGKPICEVFGEVPRECYIDSIMGDIESADADIAHDPVYFTLNLCRVLAYLRDGSVLSKSQGGEWALHCIPCEYHAAVRSALAVYGGRADLCGTCDYRGFARYMLGLIRLEVTT